MREDVLFDILNDEKFEIEGIKVDFNPIMETESGTLDEYIAGRKVFRGKKGFL